MDLLLIIDENKPHYVYIKDFDRFMIHKKKKKKNKIYFCKSCLQCLSCKNLLTEHKEVCLSINDAESVKLEKGQIVFKNAFKQIKVPFKNYSNFKCILTSAESYEGFCYKNIKITFLVVLLINLFFLMIDLVNQLFFTEVTTLLMNLLKQFLKSMNTVKK